MMSSQPKSVEKALSDITSYCAAAERCPMEVERKLRLWGLQQKDLAGVMERLMKEDFLNERRYVSAFVHDKARFDKWGPLKIRQSLLQKGLPESMVDQAIRSMEEEGGFLEAEEALSRYLSLRASELLRKERDAYRLRAQLTASGLQKGFAMETVQAVIRGLDLPKDFPDGDD